jgi:GTPase SAR1 family protein
MEGLLQLVNNLYELLAKTSISQSISLPEIVVVGDQSSGKSSLLQSIILRDILPKGNGIVTKCPIRVTVKNIPPGEEYAIFPSLDDKKYYGDEISVNLKKINDNQSSKNGGVSSKDILIDFYTSKIAALTLVDLPGIIQNVDDGKSQNLRDKIDRMVADRIKQKNTIILAICNSAVDLNNSISLRKAREADPKLKRTILIFTKMDICQDPESVISPRIKTGLGHFGVMCRSQDDISKNISLEHQIANENKFFNIPESPYSKYPDMFGVNSLRTKLEEVFKEHVMAKLPEIQKQISQHRDRVLKDLNQLGPKYEDISNYFTFAQETINTLFIKIDDVLEGKFIIDMKNTLKGGFSFRNLLEGIKEVVNSGKKNSEYDSLVDECKTIYQYSMGLEGVPTISTQVVKKILQKKILEKQEPILETVSKCRNEIPRIFGLVYDDFMKEMKTFKYFIFSKLDEALDQSSLKAENRIKNMLVLEYETVDCKVEMVKNENGSDPLIQLVYSLYNESKVNIIRNFPKLVKYYLVQGCIKKLKNNLFESLNKDYGNESSRLFPEVEKINAKRAILQRDLASLTKSSRDITSFFERF